MSGPPPPAGKPSVAELFDSLADSYDQTGVEFFRPVGARLVELLEPGLGQRVLDVGCGRGAVTVPLAQAVGENGQVTAVDVSPAMAEATRQVLAAAGHRAAVVVDDASSLSVGDGFDRVASSLVLFFLPDPAAALAGWVARARPDGGRVGLTTFGPIDDTSRALDALFQPWLPGDLLDARTTGARGPFASDEGMADLMREAGADRVDTVVEPVEIRFEDVAAWHRFSMTTGQRAMWAHVPEAERPGVLRKAAEILEQARTGETTSLVWQIRYTLGHRTR